MATGLQTHEVAMYNPGFCVILALPSQMLNHSQSLCIQLSGHVSWIWGSFCSAPASYHVYDTYTYLAWGVCVAMGTW